MISNYLIFISNQFCFWRSRRWTSTFRRKIRNNSNEGRMYFLSLLCGTEISGNGIISNLKASLLYFHIRLEWESPCSDCLSFIHTWEELEHSYAVVCQSFFFFTFNRKVILSASLRMFMETCGFLHLEFIFWEDMWIKLLNR